jgi:HTH-type transcriptional regulator / antitoxin HigA
MASITDKYLELIKSFPLRPIRSEADLDRATSVMHKLVDTSHLSAPERDYLLILGNLIQEYEAKAHPIEPLEPHEMLSSLLEARSVTQTEVSRVTGIPVSTISELLSQRRDFNVAHIEKLCAYFSVNPEAFMKVPTLEAATKS